MADEKAPAPPLSDEGIESMTQLVEAAELLGQSLGMPTVQALRFMLKGHQMLQRVQQGGDLSGLLEAFTPKRKPS